MSTSAPIAAAKHAASAAIRCAASRIQAKIAVGRSNDAYEQEADRVAETVVSHETTTESRAAAAAPGASGRAVATISRLQWLRRQEEKEEPQVSARLESSLQSTRGGGSALPGNVRSEMEPSIGADFSNVRVHTGAAAVQMNRELNAQAFTHGPNVYFNEGKYDSGSRQGKRLLAHELTHTVQQGASPRTNAAVASTGGLRIQRGIWDAVSGFVGSVGRGIQAIGQGIANLGRAVLDALLGRLGKYAKDEFPGYDLLAVVLGRDPITQQEVPRTATNLVRGVMSLVPGGKEKFNQLHESGALTRAFDWIRKKLVKLGLTWTKIRETFSLAWNSLSPEDAFHPIAAFKRIMRIFSPMINGLFKFAKAVFGKILEFIFEGFLGPGAAKVLKILRRAGSVLINIIRHPVDFIQNLVKGVRGGIDLFVTNIKKHLIAGLVTWLTGAMADVPITLPEKWDLKGIIHLVLQILGLTWDRIRQKLVKRLGEKVVKIAETSVDVIKRLVTEGPIALWEMIKEKAAEIQQKAMDGIRDWVITKVVKQAIIKLVSFLNPAGAFIQAILAIYNTIMFFVENWQRIVTFVQTVFNAIADIAKGKVAKVAQAVERGMAMAIPIILNFLARLIGLSGIGKAVTKVIEKIRKPIDKVVDKVIDGVVKFLSKAKKAGKAVVEKGKQAAKKAKEKVVQWWNVRRGLRNKAGEQHTIFLEKKEAKPVLMIKSSKSQIFKYLEKMENRAKALTPPDEEQMKAIENAKTILNEESKHIFTYAGTDEDKKQQVTTALDKVSKAFAALGGGLGEKDLPQEAVWNPARGSGKKRSSSVSVNKLHAMILEKYKGSEPPEKRNTGTTGWARIHDAGLTSKSKADRWVQMHLINEKIGGEGMPYNLVPGPNSINSGPMRTFEGTVQEMAKKPNNVIWTKTIVSYYSGEFADFASKLQMEAGLYVFKGRQTGGKAKWDKITQPQLQTTAPVPKPHLGEGPIPVSLNLSGGTFIRSFFPGLTEGFVERLKSKRFFKDKDDMAAKVRASLKTPNKKVIGQNEEQIKLLYESVDVVKKDKDKREFILVVHNKP